MLPIQGVLKDKSFFMVGLPGGKNRRFFLILYPEKACFFKSFRPGETRFFNMLEDVFHPTASPC